MSHLEDKGGEDTWAWGWTALPIALLHHQRKLGLSPVALNVLLHLLSQWWQKENLPYPSQTSIAEKVGVSTRTVQREMLQMKKNGLLKITRTSIHDEKFFGRNLYDPSPLVLRLQKLSLESLIEQEVKKKRAKSE